MLFHNGNGFADIINGIALAITRMRSLSKSAEHACNEPRTFQSCRSRICALRALPRQESLALPQIIACLQVHYEDPVDAALKRMLLRARQEVRYGFPEAAAAQYVGHGPRR